jgi:hypothetical protein
VAELFGDLWRYNVARVVVVDVSDDYRLMQPPMPSDFYPVLQEQWMPLHNLSQNLACWPLVQGYLYDWHEVGDGDDPSWYVGVVAEDLARAETANLDGRQLTA